LLYLAFGLPNEKNENLRTNREGAFLSRHLVYAGEELLERAVDGAILLQNVVDCPIDRFFRLGVS